MSKYNNLYAEWMAFVSKGEQVETTGINDSLKQHILPTKAAGTYFADGVHSLASNNRKLMEVGLDFLRKKTATNNIPNPHKKEEYHRVDRACQEKMRKDMEKYYQDCLHPVFTKLIERIDDWCLVGAVSEQARTEHNKKKIDLKKALKLLDKSYETYSPSVVEDSSTFAGEEEIVRWYYLCEKGETQNPDAISLNVLYASLYDLIKVGGIGPQGMSCRAGISERLLMDAGLLSGEVDNDFSLLSYYRLFVDGFLDEDGAVNAFLKALASDKVVQYFHQRGEEPKESIDLGLVKKLWPIIQRELNHFVKVLGLPWVTASFSNLEQVQKEIVIGYGQIAELAGMEGESISQYTKDLLSDAWWQSYKRRHPQATLAEVKNASSQMAVDTKELDDCLYNAFKIKQEDPYLDIRKQCFDHEAAATVFKKALEAMGGKINEKVYCFSAKHIADDDVANKLLSMVNDRSYSGVKSKFCSDDVCFSMIDYFRTNGHEDTAAELVEKFFNHYKENAGSTMSETFRFWNPMFLARSGTTVVEEEARLKSATIFGGRFDGLAYALYGHAGDAQVLEELKSVTVESDDDQRAFFELLTLALDARYGTDVQIAFLSKFGDKFLKEPENILYSVEDHSRTFNASVPDSIVRCGGSLAFLEAWYDKVKHDPSFDYSTTTVGKAGRSEVRLILEKAFEKKVSKPMALKLIELLQYKSRGAWSVIGCYGEVKAQGFLFGALKEALNNGYDLEVIKAFCDKGEIPVGELASYIVKEALMPSEEVQKEIFSQAEPAVLLTAVSNIQGDDASVYLDNFPDKVFTEVVDGKRLVHVSLPPEVMPQIAKRTPNISAKEQVHLLNIIAKDAPSVTDMITTLEDRGDKISKDSFVVIGLSEPNLLRPYYETYPEEVSHAVVKLFSLWQSAQDFEDGMSLLQNEHFQQDAWTGSDTLYNATIKLLEVFKTSSDTQIKRWLTYFEQKGKPEWSEDQQIHILKGLVKCQPYHPDSWVTVKKFLALFPDVPIGKVVGEESVLQVACCLNVQKCQYPAGTCEMIKEIVTKAKREDFNDGKPQMWFMAMNTKSGYRPSNAVLNKILCVTPREEIKVPRMVDERLWQWVVVRPHLSDKDQYQHRETILKALFSQKVEERKVRDVITELSKQCSDGEHVFSDREALLCLLKTDYYSKGFIRFCFENASKDACVNSISAYINSAYLALVQKSGLRVEGVNCEVLEISLKIHEFMASMPDGGGEVMKRSIAEKLNPTASAFMLEKQSFGIFRKRKRNQSVTEGDISLETLYLQRAENFSDVPVPYLQYLLLIMLGYASEDILSRVYQTNTDLFAKTINTPQTFINGSEETSLLNECLMLYFLKNNGDLGPQRLKWLLDLTNKDILECCYLEKTPLQRCAKEMNGRTSKIFPQVLRACIAKGASIEAEYKAEDLFRLYTQKHITSKECVDVLNQVAPKAGRADRELLVRAVSGELVVSDEILLALINPDEQVGIRTVFESRPKERRFFESGFLSAFSPENFRNASLLKSAIDKRWSEVVMLALVNAYANEKYCDASVFGKLCEAGYSDDIKQAFVRKHVENNDIMICGKSAILSLLAVDAELQVIHEWLRLANASGQLQRGFARMPVAEIDVFARECLLKSQSPEKALDILQGIWPNLLTRKDFGEILECEYHPKTFLQVLLGVLPLFGPDHNCDLDWWQSPILAVVERMTQADLGCMHRDKGSIGARLYTTALMQAVQINNCPDEVILTLVDKMHYKDVNAGNGVGETALSMAKKEKFGNKVLSALQRRLWYWRFFDYLVSGIQWVVMRPVVWASALWSSMKLVCGVKANAVEAKQLSGAKVAEVKPAESICRHDFGVTL